MEFSIARTPQQNGVVERMNRMVQQMACVVLDESGTPTTFWGEVSFAAVTILNKTNVQVNSTQTPHELWYGKTPTVKYFKIFGRKCYIKRTDENLGKFEPIADEDILLGYSPHSKECTTNSSFSVIHASYPICICICMKCEICISRIP